MTCNIGYIAAQDMVDQEASDFKEKDLTIVYIAHTTDVPLAKLTEKLEEHYRNGVQFSNEVIFYLSNGSEPYIVKVNTKGQNKDDFEAEIIDELWAKRSHDIDPFSDVENIINIVNDNDFIDENGKVESFSFQTESFSTYVLIYTVDFEYNDPETGETFMKKEIYFMIIKVHYVD